MGKVTISVQGYGKVVVERPRKLTKRNFADALGEAVAETCQLIIPIDSSEIFHPVLGKGGNNWDHENQRAIVRETPTPRVDVQPTGIRSLRFHMRQMWRGVLGNNRELQEELHYTGRDS